jgi:hypothetical protein
LPWLASGGAQPALPATRFKKKDDSVTGTSVVSEREELAWVCLCRGGHVVTKRVSAPWFMSIGSPYDDDSAQAPLTASTLF